ncbi:sulfite exporter TauE/SafE family protein [Desulfobotulus sp. H1]|uniref:Sulfite exporter TauE/SafE family protein n=1 Tax=Desulfobotulus pelophilus TaxID=2823377 RepID=A0ABT3N980_9BACT|nr:sulfite exporter TauE/SafE family protein [Desulfobotulus pelophilus]MCW7754011.1 sulfite exporter TauE/SafE family protein [Desulfobotulus pelophilus]
MSGLPLLPLEFPALFLAGLAFGLGICSTSCLPLVGTCILGNSRSRGDGLAALLSFSGGRLLTAALLGALFGGMGQAAMAWLKTPSMTLASGVLTVAAGIFLVLRPRCGGCRSRGRNRTPPLMLGLASPLVPCLPYAAMMAAAAATGSPVRGAGVAFVFTLGTTLSPLILACVAMGWMGAGIAARIPEQIRGFSRAAGVAVMLLGMKTLWLGFMMV